MDRLEARLNRIAEMKSAKEAVRTAVQNTAIGSQSKVPVDTGRLKHSMEQTIENGGLAGSVGYTAPYALFQEEGTRFMSGRHYLKPVFFTERVKFMNNIAKGALG